MKTYLGKGGQIGMMRVFLAQDCFEIEELNAIDITRQRIYLDDVLLVTRSRRFGWLYLTNVGVGGGISALVALGLAIDKNAAASAFFILFALIFAVLFILRLIVRLDVVTIFGRRKRCEIAYGMKKDNVQKHFEMITAAINEKIAATNARIDREKPVVPEPEVGPLPEMGSAEVVPTMENSAAINASAENTFQEPPPPPLNIQE